MLNKNEVKIFLIGASGRMGYEIRKEVSRLKKEGNRVSIIGGIVAQDDPFLEKEVDGVKFALASSWDDKFSESNVIIDFSNPDGSKKAIELAKSKNLPLMIGTTGLSEIEENAVKELGRSVKVLRARNTSVGINVMLNLVSSASKLLGDSFDIEISEIHHKLKKDAPSGTAISLLESISNSLNVEANKVKNCARVGDNALREKGEIGIQAIRGGSVAGDHTVYFFGENERLEITHRASSRTVFAEGAVRAARWLVNKDEKSGLYEMQDVFND